ncbi:ABC transporter ATP-binding protein [Anaerorhabdus furcosa]|uniref:ATP-binding cassette, subfamily B n=1 Tax=Anaerorhabdus furcosa TaxID=118967 RepID=A0A1T4QDD5_9FIRM|nr:ABC transporter ATP-binding protein [Anaerorhabdus furcosa]SKA01752.1 ATP-binding cassette, subfamily B [Anaerorhabdus furcosa]
MTSQFQEQEYNTNSLDTSLWRRILGMMKSQKKNLYMLFFLNFFIAILDVGFPFMNKIAIDYFVGNGIIDYKLTIFIVIFIVGIIAQAAIVYLFFLQAGKIEMNFAYEVREKAFHKLQSLSFSYFDKTPIGWLMARMTSDIGRLAEILSWSLMDLVWGFSVMVGVTIVMLIVNWKLALLVLIVVPILAYLSVWFQIRILKNYRSVRKINSRITSGFNEGITGAKTTKTLVLEEKNFREFEEETQNMRRSSIKAATLSALFMPLVMGLGSISTAAILWYGGYEVLLGTLQFGTLMMFTQYATQFFEPLRQIARLIAELQMAQASAERVLSLLDSQPDIVDKPEVIEKYGTLFDPKTENYEPIKGNVEFRNVSFHYLPGEPVLKNFNLTVKEGQTVALVGETGSGKSTIVNLLCRFYEPVEGQILIDGVEYRDRSLGWLRSRLGYVLQSPHLFSGTIKENIRFGRLDATDEEIIDACQLVNAHEFITKLENGYETEVGEGGGKLSTGQKQLISFARAVLVNPRIFVLDEATSSIDTETEQIIQHTIDHVLTHHTSFIIAHRLSTIVNADIILVIKKGIVVESGTHSELMAKKGYYYRLYTNQFNEDLENKLLHKG